MHGALVRDVDGGGVRSPSFVAQQSGMALRPGGVSVGDDNVCASFGKPSRYRCTEALRGSGYDSRPAGQCVQARDLG